MVRSFFQDPHSAEEEHEFGGHVPRGGFPKGDYLRVQGGIVHNDEHVLKALGRFWERHYEVSAPDGLFWSRGPLGDHRIGHITRCDRVGSHL